MANLPKSNLLIAAIATPVTANFRPDVARLKSRIDFLHREGCDGVAVFGTTGEGPEFSADQRIAVQGELIRMGADPGRMVVSAGAMAIADVVKLGQASTDAGAHGVLLMPPCVYRNGITPEGTVEFYSAVIDQVARPKLRLFLYHFPDICGVRILPEVVQALLERYPDNIVGIKDSGGELEFTLLLARRFPQITVLTGTEIHIPDVMEAGGKGTICGLANTMPRLIRKLIDLPSAAERRAVVQHVAAGDEIVCRKPFIASTKAVIAASLGDTEWRRTVPPVRPVAEPDASQIVRDFAAWEAALPKELR